MQRDYNGRVGIVIRRRQLWQFSLILIVLILKKKSLLIYRNLLAFVVAGSAVGRSRVFRLFIHFDSALVKVLHFMFRVVSVAGL